MCAVVSSPVVISSLVRETQPIPTWGLEDSSWSDGVLLTNLLVGTTTHSRKQVTCKLKPGTYLVKTQPIWSNLVIPPYTHHFLFGISNMGFSSINYFPIWSHDDSLDPKESISTKRESPWEYLGTSRTSIPNRACSRLDFGGLAFAEWMISSCSHFFIGKSSKFHHYKKSRGKYHLPKGLKHPFLKIGGNDFQGFMFFLILDAAGASSICQGGGFRWTVGL